MITLKYCNDTVAGMIALIFNATVAGMIALIIVRLQKLVLSINIAMLQ